MKEFDYEKAKAGAPVCTRDGRPARIICWDKKGGYSIVALIKENEQLEVCVIYNENGGFYECEESGDDLMMASTKNEGWVNVYRYFDGSISLSYHWTKEDADEKKALISGERRCVATVKIEWEE